MANLKTEFCELEFKNPIVVASAETGNSLDNIKKCIDYGAWGVDGVTKLNTYWG